MLVALYAGLVVLTAWRVIDTPRGFVPAQDQNDVAVSLTMPPGTSLARTDAVVQQIIPIVLGTPGVSSASVYAGMDGRFQNATNAGQIWAIFDPFEERIPKGQSLAYISGELRKRLAGITAGEIRVVNQASVRGMGNAGGFQMMVEDRGGLGYRALEEAVQQLTEAALKDPAISQSFSNFNTRNPTLDAVVDRDKAEMLGVPVRNVFTTLQTYLAGTYVNNINMLGHTFQVIAQGDASYRQDEEWVGQLKTRSASGAMVPLNAIAKLQPATAPYRVPRYNLYPAADIQGDTAPGHSSGEAMAAMERIARATLPSGMTFEWTGLAYQQHVSGDAGALAFALGVVFVFIFLAALYESLTLPLAVILIVPMCLLAAMLGVNLRGLDNNILTQIGMVVLIGLAAKNAILIVEFARQGEEHGLSSRRRRDRGREDALATHPDDVGRVHLRRDPARVRQRAGLGAAPGARRSGVLRDARRDRVRPRVHAAVLRAVPQARRRFSRGPCRACGSSSPVDPGRRRRPRRGRHRQRPSPCVSCTGQCHDGPRARYSTQAEHRDPAAEAKRIEQ